MYIAKHHSFNEREALFALIASYPLGAWVCTGATGLIANPIPFHLDKSKGPNGTLIGHVARANGVWRELNALRAGAPSVVMFQGPQAYITPGWYPSKAAHGKVVPTWNYAVAHAHGVARAIEDRDWLREMLKQLTHDHEAGQPNPWQIDDAPAEYIDKLLGAIVGIEIPIDRLEGKMKVSQDEDMPDRIGTVSGLQQSASEEAQRMAVLVGQAIALETAGKSGVG